MSSCGHRRRRLKAGSALPVSSRPIGGGASREHGERGAAQKWEVGDGARRGSGRSRGRAWQRDRTGTDGSGDDRPTTRREPRGSASSSSHVRGQRAKALVVVERRLSTVHSGNVRGPARTLTLRVRAGPRSPALWVVRDATRCRGRPEPGRHVRRAGRPAVRERPSAGSDRTSGRCRPCWPLSSAHAFQALKITSTGDLVGRPVTHCSRTNAATGEARSWRARIASSVLAGRVNRSCATSRSSPSSAQLRIPVSSPRQPILEAVVLPPEPRLREAAGRRTGWRSCRSRRRAGAARC